MWLINKWDFQNIDLETLFLYTVLEEEICMKVPEGISELLEGHCTYEDILILTNSIYGLVQAEHFWFKK